MDYDELAKKLFFSKEAAEYLGITVQRLNKLIQEEKLFPIKKNSSGTVFHIDELKRRNEELSIFVKKNIGGEKGMFEINTQTKQEALNYATVMNALSYTERKLEPLFNDLGNKVPLYKPLEDKNVLSTYSQHFKLNSDLLYKEYLKAKKAFSNLREDDEIIKRGSPDYPPLLAQTEQATRFLYIRGNKSLLYEKRTVALVGSRKASEDAKKNTKRLAKALGENGITVISGLAKGIDVTAHAEALKNGYNTIAVIGTNLNQYYPNENKSVQEEIEKKGLVVSQFSPAAKTQRWFFPMRNGVMSGLSLATVIIEAGETSGALRQADFALKQGRQILIPESALRIPNITWPEKYVKKGAVLVKTPNQVLEILAKNNIFKVKKETKIKQQTLGEYIDIGSTVKKHNEKKKENIKPILIKGKKDV